jgi:hypothetical protein
MLLECPRREYHGFILPAIATEYQIKILSELAGDMIRR